MSMKYRTLMLSLFVIYFVITITQTVFACQPIVQLFIVFSGTAFFTRSIIGLIIGVLIKSIVFALFENNINKLKSFYLMIFANVFSSISGLFLGFSFAAPMFFPLTILVTYGFVSKPAKRLGTLKLEKFPKISARALAVFLTLSSILTIVLFSLALDNLQTGQVSLKYWLAKISYVTLGIMVSITISGLIEEYVISYLVNTDGSLVHFFPSVFRANLVTSLVLVGYVAVKTIPERLNTSDWLTFFSSIMKIIAIFY